MKVFVVLCLVAGAFGSLEPAGYRPPSNRYIPADRQNSATTSQRSQYLPPVEPTSSNQYISQPSSFDASQKNLDNQYLAPFNSQQDSNHGSARNYLSPAIDRASSSQYKPYSSSASSSSSSFSSPSYQSSPSSSHTSYTAPSSAYSSATNSYSSPSKSYGPASQGLNRGYPSGRNYQEESEPANYNFEYRVNDGYGNDFGHKENRQDEKSYGIYSVLLPDGRKQIVEYEADEQGFRPKISYEEFGGEFKNAKGQNLEGPY